MKATCNVNQADVNNLQEAATHLKMAAEALDSTRFSLIMAGVSSFDCAKEATHCAKEMKYCRELLRKIEVTIETAQRAIDNQTDAAFGNPH